MYSFTLFIIIFHCVNIVVLISIITFTLKLLTRKANQEINLLYIVIVLVLE